MPAEDAKSPPSPKVPSKLECRHTLSAKKGFLVPETVRRALSGSAGTKFSSNNGGSTEDLSGCSSSCQSNLENIRPPTVMEDMDNSILSIASLSSEVADNLNTEQLFEIARPDAMRVAKECAEAAESPSLARKLANIVRDDETQIVDVEVPSAMDDVSGVITDRTLVADVQQPVGGGATYTVAGTGDDQSTCRDVTDVFGDDDTTLEQHTFTLESDKEEPGGADAMDDLPRDASRRTTPAGSREHTPKSRRKAEVLPQTPAPNLDHFKKYEVPIPDLDDSASDYPGHDTSGYKSDSAAAPAPLAIASPAAEVPTAKSTPSSRQRRKEESDRFRTHTITKDDLSGNNTTTTSGSSREGSPRLLRKPGSTSSVKQRREEEAERFRTRTITASDLKAPKSYDAQEVLFDLQQLEEEAKLVVDAICTDQKKDLRSRSASVEILKEGEMTLQMQIGVGSDPSLAASPKRGPRICKPGEASPRHDSSDDGAKGVRGRRRNLYTASPKRSTVPPAVPPKPSLPPKPMRMTSAPTGLRMAAAGGPARVSSPTQIRGTRASTLRQQGNSATRNRNGSPPSPKVSPRHVPTSTGSTSSLSSARSSASSSTRRSSSKRSLPIPLARQGTFTKDEPTVTASSGDESIGKKTSPANRPQPSKPSSIARRDVVHPQRIASPGSSSVSSYASSTSRSRAPVVISQTKTSAMRERSSSRNASATNLRRSQATSSSNSSLNSARSSNTSKLAVMKPSNSSHALKAVSERPASKGPTPMKASPNVSETQSEKGLSPAGKKGAGKKEVTSRIANLWKKVEDSKKKGKQEVDPRVWITKGKVIPENELALLRRHDEQRQIVEGFQASKKAVKSPSSNSLSTTDEANNLKPRSKSRLSIKLSKFKSGSKKDLKSPSTEATTADDELKNLDSLNGNACQLLSPQHQEDQLVEEVEVMPPSASAQQPDLDEAERAKRLSRLGSFLNPPNPNECGLPTADPIRFGARRDMAGNRSPAPASAIVPPFNYSPPVSSSGVAGPSPQPPPQKPTMAGSEFRVPAVPPRPSAIPSRTVSTVQVKRNDSYVSSMGRKSPPNQGPPPLAPRKRMSTPASMVGGAATPTEEEQPATSSSSSVLVTLV